MDEAMRRMGSGTECTSDADLEIEAVVETVEAKTEVCRAPNEQLEDHRHSSSRPVCRLSYRVQWIWSAKRSRRVWGDI
jgi:hypothetical protein